MNDNHQVIDIYLNNQFSDIKNVKVAAINIFTDLNEIMNKVKGSMRTILNQLQNINKLAKKSGGNYGVKFSYKNLLNRKESYKGMLYYKYSWGGGTVKYKITIYLYI